VKVALLDTREIRMIGDAGPRPPSLDLLSRPGWEDRAGAAFARKLIDDAPTWDLIELEPLADPSRVRANLVQRLAPAGFAVESSTTAGGASRIALALARRRRPTAWSGDDVRDDLAALRKGMSALRRLSRLEWSERDEPSPLGDPEAMGLLEEVALAQGKLGRIRLARLDDSQGEACAAALVVDDSDRAVVLAMAVDPQAKRASARLLHAEALAARARGCVALDVAGVGHRSLATSSNLPSRRVGATTPHPSADGDLVARAGAREDAVPPPPRRVPRGRDPQRGRERRAHDRYCLYRGQLDPHRTPPASAQSSPGEYDSSTRPSLTFSSSCNSTRRPRARAGAAAITPCSRRSARAPPASRGPRADRSKRRSSVARSR
jgi:hypothetical protein